MDFFRTKFPCKIGFSDHSLGIRGSLMAAYKMADIIEKHITLDNSAWGPDHKASILPEELTELITKIDNNQFLKPSPEALGVETKFVNNEEMPLRKLFHKGLYASEDLKRGYFEPSSFYAMRPKGEAHSAELYTHFLGKKILKPISKYGIIN